MYFFNKFIRNKFLLKHKYSDSVMHKYEHGHEVSTTAAVPQILPQVESAWRGLDSAWFEMDILWRWEVLCLSVWVWLFIWASGLWVVFSGWYFDLTFDPGCTVCTACTVYLNGKPSAEQFHTGCGPDNQNSTSTVGAGLEFQKTTVLPTRTTSSKK
jgi:hypothetical protein